MTTMTTGNGRNDHKELVRTMEFKLRYLMKDTVCGRFDHKEKQNIPETGSPWGQIQRIRIGGIDGWVAAVDAFDFVNSPFVKLSKKGGLGGDQPSGTLCNSRPAP